MPNRCHCSRRFNELTLQCLARWLAQHDLVAVLRVTCTLTAEVTHDQYWALVPPSADKFQSTAVPPSTESDSANTSITRTGAATMQLVRLADRDDLLLPGFNYGADSTAANTTELDRLPSVEAELVQEVEDYLEDSLISSLGPPRLYHPAYFPTGSLTALVNVIVCIYSLLHCT